LRCPLTRVFWISLPRPNDWCANIKSQIKACVYLPTAQLLITPYQQEEYGYCIYTELRLYWLFLLIHIFFEI
jgi:hypothetical protein